MCFEDLAGVVLCIADLAELKSGGVRLGIVRQDAAGFRRIADKYRQHTCCHRIERSCVTEALHVKNAAQLSDHIKGCPALRLVDQQDTVHSASSTAASRRSRISSRVPSSWHPAALIWPPPPNFWQMADTFTSRAERMEIL